MIKKRAAIYRSVAETIHEEHISMGICWAFGRHNISVYVDYQFDRGIVFSDRAIKKFPELDIYNLEEYTMRYGGYVSSYLNCSREDRITMMLLLAEMTENDSK